MQKIANFSKLIAKFNMNYSFVSTDMITTLIIHYEEDIE